MKCDYIWESQSSDFHGKEFDWRLYQEVTCAEAIVEKQHAADGVCDLRAFIKQ